MAYGHCFSLFHFLIRFTWNVLIRSTLKYLNVLEFQVPVRVLVSVRRVCGIDVNSDISVAIVTVTLSLTVFA